MDLENGNNHVNILDFGSDHDLLVQQLEKSDGVSLRRHESGKPEVDFSKTKNRSNFER